MNVVLAIIFALVVIGPGKSMFDPESLGTRRRREESIAPKPITIPPGEFKPPINEPKKP